MLRRRRTSGDGGRLAACSSPRGVVLLIVLTLAAAHPAPATASPVPLAPPEAVADLPRSPPARAAGPTPTDASSVTTDPASRPQSVPNETATSDLSTSLSEPSSPSPEAASSSPSSPTTLPVPSLDQGELARSIERAVARILEEGRDPCAHAKRENKPCFPTAVEREGPRVSVSEDFKKWTPLAQGSNQRTLRRLVSPTGTVTPALSFDPVCLGRLLVRSFKGKNITYYLYRAPDPDGERAVLRENEIPASAGPTNPESAYILVRKVTGECAAIAAYDALNREVRERNRQKTGKADHRALRLAGPPAP